VPIPDELIQFWRALDGLFGEPEPTWWGAVVTDPRFPTIWDANYARIDRPVEGLTRAEVEQALGPALGKIGARAIHVVSFFPEETRDLLAELSTLGDELSWDVVMQLERPAQGMTSHADIRPIAPSDDLWSTVRESFKVFGIVDPSAVAQLIAIERDVLTPAGKRWFGASVNGEVSSVAALLVLESVAYLDNVATFPPARGRGLASAVAAHLARTAFAEGATSVFLLVDPDGPIGLYRRLGFAEVGRIASTRGRFPRARHP
jgi:ribosomal protein S18 acetylase RimI-like enzyme